MSSASESPAAWSSVAKVRLCAEQWLRGEMTDEEFWEHVYTRLQDEHWLADTEPQVVSLHPTPCSECGELGSCGNDAEGRPWIHVQREEDGDGAD